MILLVVFISNYYVMKKLNDWINKFSFFEYIGLLTFGTIISNYFLNKPLINIGIFFGYCLLGSILSMSKLYLNYKKIMMISRVKNERKI